MFMHTGRYMQQAHAIGTGIGAGTYGGVTIGGQDGIRRLCPQTETVLSTHTDRECTEWKVELEGDRRAEPERCTGVRVTDFVWRILRILSLRSTFEDRAPESCHVTSILVLRFFLSRARRSQTFRVCVSCAVDCGVEYAVHICSCCTVDRLMRRQTRWQCEMGPKTGTVTQRSIKTLNCTICRITKLLYTRSARDKKR